MADRLPFVRAETVTSLVQKVADRMKILFTSSDLLMKAGGWAAANWLLDCASLYVFLLAFGAHVDPDRHRSSPTGWPTSWPSSRSRRAAWAWSKSRSSPCSRPSAFPGDVAAAGVLSWRLVNFWLPIPFGGASYLSLRLGHPRPATAKAIPT